MNKQKPFPFCEIFVKRGTIPTTTRPPNTCTPPVQLDPSAPAYTQRAPPHCNHTTRYLDRHTFHHGSTTSDAPANAGRGYVPANYTTRSKGVSASHGNAGCLACARWRHPTAACVSCFSSHASPGLAHVLALATFAAPPLFDCPASSFFLLRFTSCSCAPPRPPRAPPARSKQPCSHTDTTLGCFLPTD